MSDISAKINIYHDVYARKLHLIFEVGAKQDFGAMFAFHGGKVAIFS